MTRDLFGNDAAPDMIRTASFSGENDCHRNLLRRIWDDRLPMLVVCMLNPSTADHRIDDPTVLVLIHFGKLWGYGGLTIINLYNWRSPSPASMKVEPQRLGEFNGIAHACAMTYARDNGGRLLVAWGNDGDFEGEATRFADFAIRTMGLELICLGTTASGAPKHPMARGQYRIPRDQQPIIWRRGAP